jgi:pimeloyl-ACP methyl ester carboxylesterase
MADAAPSPSASDKDKKEHQPPKGATQKVVWTNDAGQAADVEVTSEWIVLRKKERPAAEIFHTYYRLAEVQGKAERRRPVSFVFNGGPGASSAYLHVGGLSRAGCCSSRRQARSATGAAREQSESWIAFTDLVSSIPSAPASRIIEAERKPDDKEKPDPAKTVEEKEFYALNRDLEALGELIERFLSKYKLWDVPVFVVGESYGGFRTAKLARSLQEKHGVGLSAAIAISPALEWSLLNGGDYDVLHSMVAAPWRWPRPSTAARACSRPARRLRRSGARSRPLPPASWRMPSSSARRTMPTSRPACLPGPRISSGCRWSLSGSRTAGCRSVASRASF